MKQNSWLKRVSVYYHSSFVFSNFRVYNLDNPPVWPTDINDKRTYQVSGTFRVSFQTSFSSFRCGLWNLIFYVESTLLKSLFRRDSSERFFFWLGHLYLIFQEFKMVDNVVRLSLFRSVILLLSANIKLLRKRLVCLKNMWVNVYRII